MGAMTIRFRNVIEPSSVAANNEILAMIRLLLLPFPGVAP